VCVADAIGRNSECLHLLSYPFTHFTDRYVRHVSATGNLSLVQNVWNWNTVELPTVHISNIKKTNKQTPWPETACELYRPSDRISNISDGKLNSDALSCLKTKFRGLSPRADYTDRATAACRRSDCQLLRIEGTTWSA
jgi:hypothetical protein